MQKHKRFLGALSNMMILVLVLALFAPGGVASAQDGNGLDSSGEVSSTETSASAGPLAQVISVTGVETVPDHYIVVYKSGGDVVSAESSIRASVAANGGSVTYVYDSILNGFAAYLPAKALKAVLADPKVDYVAPDIQMHLDQEISIQTVQMSAVWGLDRIDQHILPFSGTYGYGYTGKGVNVYVIDTGIRSTHKQFGGRATKDYDVIGDGQNGNDCNGHGTHVAGTIGGTTFGVAKGVRIHAIRVLNCQGNGLASGVIAGLNYVGSHAVKPAVASMSLGGSAYAPLDTAVNNLINKGVVVVVAAGNNGANACSYSPARVPNAITVGATSYDDSRAYYSNYGSCLDIFAPGSYITSAWNTSDTATNTISGTSMATPHVSGVVALYLQTHPSDSVASVVSAIKSQATTGMVTGAGSGSPNRLLYSLVNREYYNTAILVSPRSWITDNSPTFKWGRVTYATKYTLQVYKGSSLVVNKTFSTSICSKYYCTYTMTTGMAKAGYTWKVRAYINGAWEPYTPAVSFTIY